MFEHPIVTCPSGHDGKALGLKGAGLDSRCFERQQPGGASRRAAMARYEPHSRDGDALMFRLGQGIVEGSDVCLPPGANYSGQRVVWDNCGPSRNPEPWDYRILARIGFLSQRRFRGDGQHHGTKIMRLNGILRLLHEDRTSSCNRVREG